MSASEVVLTITLDVRTMSIKLDGPLDKQELCLDLLEQSKKVVREYNEKNPKSGVSLT